MHCHYASVRIERWLRSTHDRARHGASHHSAAEMFLHNQHQCNSISLFRLPLNEENNSLELQLASMCQHLSTSQGHISLRTDSHTYCLMRARPRPDCKHIHAAWWTEDRANPSLPGGEGRNPVIAYVAPSRWVPSHTRHNCLQRCYTLP